LQVGLANRVMPMLSVATMRRACALLFLWLAACSASAQEKPESLVAGVITALGAALKADEVALAGERALPAAVAIINRDVAPHMDFAGITREAVGPHWANASPVQRGALEREFRQLLVHVLARLLVTNKGDVLEALPTSAGPAAREALVRVAVTRQRTTGTQTQVAMQVTLRRNDGVWRVYELRTDGVDVVKLYSANFAVVIARDGGIDGLIRALAERNALNAGIAVAKPRSVPTE
jgi:phospholipid transport system substrate-binding protein